MSWVVKSATFGDYMIGHRPIDGWVRDRKSACRFATLVEARQAASGCGAFQRTAVFRLVPKRKPEPMPSMRLRDLIAYRERMERESIAAWFERTFTNGILGTDTARRIRAGEHHR